MLREGERLEVKVPQNIVAVAGSYLYEIVAVAGSYLYEIVAVAGSYLYEIVAAKARISRRAVARLEIDIQILGDNNGS